MTILVISDTHKDLKNARLAIQHTMESGLNMVIHCGDHIEDAKRLEKVFPKITFYYVPGNCDGWFFRESDKTKVLKIKNKRILFTHGDSYHIHYNYDQLFEVMEQKGAVLGLCGHTHIAHVERRNKTGRIVVNPGSITDPRDSKYPSYAVLKIAENQEIEIQMMMIKDGKSVENIFLK